MLDSGSVLVFSCPWNYSLYYSAGIPCHQAALWWSFTLCLAIFNGSVVSQVELTPLSKLSPPMIRHSPGTFLPDILPRVCSYSGDVLSLNIFRLTLNSGHVLQVDPLSDFRITKSIISFHPLPIRYRQFVSFCLIQMHILSVGTRHGCTN